MDSVLGNKYSPEMYTYTEFEVSHALNFKRKIHIISSNKIHYQNNIIIYPSFTCRIYRTISSRFVIRSQCNYSQLPPKRIIIRKLYCAGSSRIATGKNCKQNALLLLTLSRSGSLRSGLMMINSINAIHPIFSFHAHFYAQRFYNLLCWFMLHCITFVNSWQAHGPVIKFVCRINSI